MRVFIALNIPATERRRIHRAAKRLREGAIPVRWIDPDAFHVTLKFLGDVRPDRISSIEVAIARVAAATRSFDTELGGFGAFPTVRRPRVLWLGVGANPELRCLKQDLEWALSDLGFQAETRAFHPHVTLGRADEDGAGAFRGLDELVAELDYGGTLKVSSVELMRSHLTREGAHYSILSTSKLTGAGPGQD